MNNYPIGSIVVHKTKPEFGYGIVVKDYGNFALSDEPIFIVLWHGDENIELREIPQLHKYSELKVLNTEVAFA